MYKAYEKYLDTRHNSGKYRRLISKCQESSFDILDFSSNDYLNLSRNVDVIAAGTQAAEIYGVGSSGSRLLSGNYPLFQDFETSIAADKNTSSSLIFNTGFQANISALSAILDEKILGNKACVFFDKYNHASLYHAALFRKVELFRYHHNDLNHLEDLLKQYSQDSRPKFIVTESVFGMDGDVAPLEEILQLAKKFQAFVYLDEAHATGVLGKHGYGLSTYLNWDGIAHMIMGTFSKAIGVSGGYIACNNIMHDFLINTATGFIYSTAPSPMVVGAAWKAWQKIRDFEQERAYLQKQGHTLRQMLHNAGYDTGLSQTHIIPILFKEERVCLKVQNDLLKHGILVSCIRPPTVPPGTSRLRIALSTKHTENDMVRLVETLKGITL